MVSEPPEEKESNSQPIITSVNDQLKSVIKQHLTDCDLTSIPVLTPYEITKYDGLFLFSIEKLKALCEKKNVKTDDCKIKYHYVSRIKCVDENFHLFEDIKLPVLSDPNLVDRYREQLLLFEGAPGIMDKNSARNSACEHLRTHSWKMPVTIGSVYYVNFGTVIGNLFFHNDHCLYPRGYHSRKLFASVQDPGKIAWYDNWIEEKDGLPLFIVSLENETISYGNNINEVWLSIIRRIPNGEETAALFSDLYVGESFFFLVSEFAQWSLESQEASLQCQHYLFYFQRAALGDAMTICQKEEMLREIEQDYEQSVSTTIQECIDQDSTFIPTAVLESMAQKYCSYMKGRQEVLQMRAKLMQSREKDMQERNSQLVKAMSSQPVKRPAPSKVESQSKKLQSSKENHKPSQSAELPKGKMPSVKNEAKNAKKVESNSKNEASVPSVKRKEEKEQSQSAQGSPKSTLEPFVLSSSSHNIIKHFAEGTMHDLPSYAGIPVILRPKSDNVCLHQDVSSMRCCMEATKASVTTSSHDDPFFIDSVDYPMPRKQHPFSLLPDHLVETALSTWDFFSTFSIQFQLPRISYQAFEYSLCHPAPMGVLERMMSVVLMVLFSQLKALLLKHDKLFTVVGWKPFYGGAFHCLAWSELARILFTCYSSFSFGFDINKIVKHFQIETRHGSKTAISKNPGKSLDSIFYQRNHMFDENTLGPTDHLKYIRFRALLYYLLSVELFHPLRNLLDIGLIFILKDFVYGAFCDGSHFYENRCYDRLKYLWEHTPIALYLIVKYFRTVVEENYQSWVVSAVEGQRGPWDEVFCLDQPCKVCWERGIQGKQLEPCVVCKQCMASFHYTCLTPVLLESQAENWVCGLCSGRKEQTEWKAPSRVEEGRESQSCPTTTDSNDTGRPPSTCKNLLSYYSLPRPESCLVSPLFWDCSLLA